MSDYLVQKEEKREFLVELVEVLYLVLHFAGFVACVASQLAFFGDQVESSCQVVLTALELVGPTARVVLEVFALVGQAD